MSVYQQLVKTIKLQLELRNKWTQELQDEIPKKWEKHGSLYLFSANSFKSAIWRDLDDGFWPIICQILKADKLARKTGAIQNDEFRSPSIELLYGQDTWVTKLENGIRFEWDLSKCMFSSGNISEKQRISSWDCKGQVIVDLYAGIGYFTLSYLVHAKAEFVYACEWNPHSVQALQRNLEINNASQKCQVLFGDNSQIAPKNVADHVNLGLLPKVPACALKTGCLSLKKSYGGILHIHGNVDILCQSKDNFTSVKNNPNFQLIDENHKSCNIDWIKWVESLLSYLDQVFIQEYSAKWQVQVISIHKIKSFGPRVDHLVVDVKCTPCPSPNVP